MKGHLSSFLCASCGRQTRFFRTLKVVFCRLLTKTEILIKYWNKLLNVYSNALHWKSHIVVCNDWIDSMFNFDKSIITVEMVRYCPVCTITAVFRGLKKGLISKFIHKTWWYVR